LYTAENEQCNYRSFNAIFWKIVTAGIQHFLLPFFIFVILSYNVRFTSYLQSLTIWPSSGYANLTNSILFPSTSTTISTTTLITDRRNPPDIVVAMDDRVPSYKLIIRSEDKLYAEGNRAQAKVLEELRLYEICQRDPSTIVVDVGAFLGRI
jgi:hypothetical protein